MGWALKNLSRERRKALVEDLLGEVREDKGEIWASCPFHNEQEPSWSYNLDEDVFYCQGCQAKGDLVSLWGHFQSYTDNTEAFNAFRKAFGDESEPQGKKGKGGQGKGGKQAAKVIPESEWERMAPLPEDWLVQLERERGWSREILGKLGVRQETVAFNSKTGQVEPVNSAPYRIAIPVRDDNGRLMNVRRYRRPGAQAKQKILSWGTGYGSTRLFPPGSKLGKDGLVYLCEGEPDTLCALSKGLNAITQTGKTSTWSESHLAPFRGRDVVIAYDADKPGQNHAGAAAGNLVRVAKTVRVLEWPEFMGRLPDGSWPESGGQDLTDFFVRHGRSVQDLQDLVALARKVEAPPAAYSDPEGWRQFGYTNDKGNWTFKSVMLARRIMDDSPLTFEPMTGILYHWNGRFWDRYTEEAVQRRAALHLDLEANGHRITDTWRMVKALSTLPDGRETNDRPDWVCLKNGMLNLTTLELRQHDRDFLATYELPVVYDPKNVPRPELWEHYLKTNVITPEVIMQLQEFAGYCLTRETRYGKCLFLLGPGEDGKSVFLKILRRLVGEENTSSVPFRDLQDQFLRAALYGKVLNTGTEIGSEALQSDIFKAITTGDPIQAAFKHKDAFEFVPFVKLAFAGNTLPRVLDNSHGFYRRFMPVEFKRQFKEGDPDRDEFLEDKLVAELSGIFEWALVGLHRLRMQGGFTRCDETFTLLHKYRRSNNPIQVFLDDLCDIDPQARAIKSDVWKAYKAFCREGGYGQKSEENFWRDLYTACPDLKPYRPTINGVRVQCVRGMSLVLEEGPGDV